MAIKLTQQDLKYINEIKAYAIQNPEWFWSNSEDASEARQWLYSHGASGIVDEIYQETPDNIKQTIDNKKLSSSSQFDKFHEEWKDKQEDASKVVAGTLAASAAAPFAIGGLASAAGTGALGNAGRYALGKADDAVAWLSKSGTKVYDPRHIVQTLLNPTKAYTGAGQAAASTLDVLGAGIGLKHADETVGRWRNGDFHLSDVPQVGLDLVGTIPAVNYFRQMGVSVPRMLSTMYDNTVRSYNNMKNGIEPVYGIRAPIDLSDSDIQRLVDHHIGSSTTRSSRAAEDFDWDAFEEADDIVPGHRLPDPPGEVIIDMPLQSQTPYLQPTQPTQRYQAPVEHVRPASDGDIDFAGRRLIGDYADSIRSSNNSDLDELDEIAGIDEQLDPMDIVLRGRSGDPVNIESVQTGYSEPKYRDLLERVNLSLGVFDDVTFNKVRPRIKQVIEQGFASKKSPEEIELALDKIWEEYNKPMFKERSLNFEGARAELPNSWYPIEEVLSGNIKREYVNPAYSRTKLDIDSVPKQINPQGDQLGYSHYVVIDSDAKSVDKLKRAVENNTPHGGATFEYSKSLQSSPLAHQGYVRQAKQGKGIISYVAPYSGNGYSYADTNMLEGSTWSPRLTGGRINNPSGSELLDLNIRHWEDMLDATDQRVFDSFGGAPTHLDLTIRTPEMGYVPKKITMPIRKHHWSIAPENSQLSHPFVRPNTKFKKEGQFYVDTSEADRAVAALDRYVDSARADELANVEAIRNDWVSDLQGIELPYGAKVIDTKRGIRIQIPSDVSPVTVTPERYLKDFKSHIVPRKNNIFSKLQAKYRQRIADKTLQQIRPDLETIIDQSNTLEKQHREALSRIKVPGVGMSLYQPLAGFRRFKLGGHMPKYFRMFGK